MRTIIHDLSDDYRSALERQAETVVSADGRYAPCVGCFHCWTRHPATCALKDSLHTVCRQVGEADDLVIITSVSFGSYSSAVKNILDRSIGSMTPMFAFRGHQMHHGLRYGQRSSMHVYVHGNVDDADYELFSSLVQRNGLNVGFRQVQVQRLQPEMLLTNKEFAL